ncbi:MAG: zeta toxin family protein [Verrucomicrobium sp.]
MFAGPNGSGKSTIKGVVPENLLGVYINPDEMQKQMESCGFLDLLAYKVAASQEEVLQFFSGSVLLCKAGMDAEAARLRLVDGQLDFRGVEVNAYYASVAADFLRQKLIESRISFSFETVMSSRDKVELLRKAQAVGYRTYLYFIATDDPSINVARVRARVSLGGHDVPEEKIVQRYTRSLGLLLPAIKHSDRAYLFDNSADGRDHLWVAEITGGDDLEMRSEHMPLWFLENVWEKIHPEE